MLNEFSVSIKEKNSIGALLHAMSNGNVYLVIGLYTTSIPALVVIVDMVGTWIIFLVTVGHEHYPVLENFIS